jgi:hypothetical protein
MVPSALTPRRRNHLPSALAGLLSDHPARDFHHGEQLQRLDAADSFQASEVRFLPGDQSRQRARFADQPRGEGEDILSAGPAAQEHCDQLGVAQCARSKLLKPFLRAIPRGHFPQAIHHRVFRGAGHAILLDRFSATANLLVP